MDCLTDQGQMDGMSLDCVRDLTTYTATGPENCFETRRLSKQLCSEGTFTNMPNQQGLTQQSTCSRAPQLSHAQHCSEGHPLAIVMK